MRAYCGECLECQQGRPYFCWAVLAPVAAPSGAIVVEDQAVIITECAVVDGTYGRCNLARGHGNWSKVHTEWRGARIWAQWRSVLPGDEFIRAEDPATVRLTGEVATAVLAPGTTDTDVLRRVVARLRVDD